MENEEEEEMENEEEEKEEEVEEEKKNDDDDDDDDNTHNCVSKFICYFGFQVILNIQLLVTVVINWLYGRQTGRHYFYYLYCELFVCIVYRSEKERQQPAILLQDSRDCGILSCRPPFLQRFAGIKVSVQ